MNIKILVAAISLTLPLSAPTMFANSTDGSMNLDRRPSLALTVALGKANVALGKDAGKFVCTEAKSKKRSSGGGWLFCYKSDTLHCRYVGIDHKGEVIHNKDASQAAQFKTGPSQSLEKAIAAAVTTRQEPKRWFAVFCYWTEKDDEWYVSLVNSHRELVAFIVDGKGKVRELPAIKK